MKNSDRKLTAVVTWLTALMAGLFGVALPTLYFALSYSFQDSALQTEAEINARIASALVNSNPEMWRFEELRFEELMRRRPSTRTPEIRRIRDLDGRLVAESIEELHPPFHTRRAELKDSGRTVGTIEITRSLLPIFLKTGLLAFAGAALGLAGFLIFRSIPLRILHGSISSLFKEKERAQVTLRSIGDGVITTDADGRVQLMNAVAEKLTGWTQNEALGRQVQDVFSIVNEGTGELCENPVARVLREQRTIELANDTVLLGKDGKERMISDSGAPIRDENGSIIGVVLVFRDVTEKKKHLREMARADKLESVGLLAGGIAHDFNNLLSTILGNVSLAQLSPSCNAELQDLLVRTEDACLRAKGLTHQLLTFAKGGSPVKETVDLPELIRASADFTLTGSNVRAVVEVLDDIPAVRIDGSQINQVINNLVINAKEAMPDGGVITIRIKRAQLRDHDVAHLPAGTYVSVSVRDQGPGIEAEVISKIFDPYFTTKNRGSGLGLTTSYSIIKKHDGHLEVSSRQGMGSTFRFYLPVMIESPVPEKNESSGSIQFGKGRVLLMDDEEIIQSTSSQMLTRLGYEVVIARDGAEAIDRYLEAQRASKPFDAVILDLTVPGGMGGEETIRKLLDRYPEIRAIVSSGYSENPVMSDFRSHGFSAVLAKPYTLKELSVVLQTVLQMPS